MHPHSVTGLSVRRCYHTQCLKLPNHVFLCLTLSILGHVLLCLLLSRLISWNWQWGKFASGPLCKSICQSHFSFVSILPLHCPLKNHWKVGNMIDPKYFFLLLGCSLVFRTAKLIVKWGYLQGELWFDEYGYLQIETKMLLTIFLALQDSWWVKIMFSDFLI